jgi:hypothetical protein
MTEPDANLTKKYLGLLRVQNNRKRLITQLINVKQLSL